ncbi:PA14 domain-containing protein [Isoptericola sp. NPDC057191]|uniref:PA14 domain-containing protein n=1 Tax=Isoptericola sp. NPDC057191 TaxID=3346041 RepID=UPI00363372BE
MSALSQPRFRRPFAVLAAVATALAGLAAAPASGADEIEVHGLKGEYFAASAPDAHDFAELGGVALDPNIDLPNLVPTFESLTGKGEHTTARWTGNLTAPTTGDYTFYAVGDNGFRLFLDDEAVIDHWVGDWDVEQTSETVHLEAGAAHTFRMELFQDVGGANLFLRWSGPGIGKQVVPSSAFTPPDDYEVFPVELTTQESGTRLSARFEEPVSDLGTLADHLSVEADTVPMPIQGVRVDPRDRTTAQITLVQPVQQGQRVRFSYDGDGGLTVGRERVPAILRDADNRSTHRLLTPWGEKLDRKHPLPEYPRPQQERTQWRNLNGSWQFQASEEGATPTFGKDLDERITVPFPVESLLSGIERHEDHMVYRKEVTVPRGWRQQGQRVKLNFGAVDYQATVYVNGKQVAEHTGGYTAFSADITDALRGRGRQELVVAVSDTTGKNQPRGKQVQDPSGIWYTPSSGIWQTVWMEPVPASSIDDLRTTPDVEHDSLEVEAAAAGASDDAVVTAVARDTAGSEVGRVSGPADEPLTLELTGGTTHLWSPDDPYLYDLDVTLRDGASTDRMRSYFAMRSVGVEQVNGVPKMVLNGEPIFSLAMLDQGFYPDGLYTPPSDDALVFDLRAQKDLGFNAVRKHIKVEPMRWYYHADRLGLMVWQDFVSGDLTDAAGRKAFLDQGKAEMAQLHSSPSVVGWIPFNEGWGEWDRDVTGQIADEVKEIDPSRIVNAHSGVNCCDSKGDSGRGDVIDHHDYTNTDPPFPDETRMAMDGEHGGFTLRTPGHQWPGAPAAIYSGVADKAALTRRYVDNTREFYLPRAGGDLSGSIYTQVTDLETELNGLWTYDRREIKVDPGPVRSINEQVIEAGANAGR